MEFDPIRSSSLQEEIYKRLMDAITSGNLHPGERLSLEGLAEQFNVSIMPVREAFSKLEATKLVTREKYRCLKVSELSSESLNEIMMIRLMLEPNAAEIAAEIRSEETVKHLESLHRRMEELTDIDIYLPMNQEFHYTIYKAANYPILMEMIESLWQRVSPYLYILLRNDKEHPHDKYWENHQGMLDALRDKNKMQIREWLTKELTEAKEKIIANFKQIELKSSKSF
jgi:DNA-binding GntR family transcriptional regulator